MLEEAHKSQTNLPGEHVLNRIAGLTLGIGFVTVAVAMALHRVDWAKGLAGGAVLGWLNFRWLRRGIRAVVNTALAQAHTQRNPVAKAAVETPARGAKSAASVVSTYLALVFRYALVAAGVYVIFAYLHVPLLSIGLGLCALIAAIIAASVWEVVKPGE